MFSKRYLISQQCILLSLYCVSVTPLFAAPPEDPIRIKNVPALINYIKGKDKYNRQEALLKLQVMGAEAKAAVPVLAETLSDPDEDIRALAFDALRAMQESAAPAVPTLIKVIEGDDTDDRRHAIEVLSRMGNAARPALPVLRKAAKDPDFMVSDDAKEVLESLGEKQPDSTDDSKISPTATPEPSPTPNPGSSPESNAKPPGEKNRNKPSAAVPGKYKDLDAALSAKREQLKSAWSAMMSNDLPSAIKQFNDQIASDPQSPANTAAYTGLGMSYCLSKDFRNAEASFVKALALMPLKDFHVIKSPNLEALVSIVYSGLLIAHLNEDKLESAINDERQLAKYDRARAEEAYLFCGTIYGCLGRYEDGVREMDSVLKVNPKNTTAQKMRTMFISAETDAAMAAELNRIMREKLEDRITKGNANLTVQKLNQYDPDKQK